MGRAAKKYDYSHISDVDWGRLAMLLDGEGHIKIAKRSQTARTSSDGYIRGTRYWLDVRIANTDPRMTEWCRKTFGAKVYIGNAGRELRGHKRMYYWVAVDNCALALLKGCLPYFIVKREQAEIAIAFRATFGVAMLTEVDEVTRKVRRFIPAAVVEQRERYRQDLKSMYARGVQ